MRNMIIIIIILLIIFVGMVIHKNNLNTNTNNVTVNEVQNIEEYISKIYMWKEVTNEALPTFENIDSADEMWIWEVVKKNIEEYELEYQDIQNMLKSIFGENINKQFPQEGNSSFEYDSESGKYFSTGINLDNKEDKFLINKIEKMNDTYKIEIIEYIEDYSQAEDLEEGSEYEIIIRNLQNEEIAKIKNTENQTNVNEFIKTNIDSFSKKELIIKKGNEERLYIEQVTMGNNGDGANWQLKK